MIVAGGIAVLVVAFFAAAFVARRRFEIRARVLETCARAADRGLPVAPLLERAAREHRGRARLGLQAVHRRLAEGAPLSLACAGARGLFPRHVVGAIEAAEGTAMLPRALELAARDTQASLSLRHRVLLAALYPALVAVGLALLQIGFMPRYVELGEILDASNGLFAALPAIGWTAIALVGVGAAWLLARRPNLLRAERLLRSVALLVAAGEPFAHALRKAGAGGAARRLDAGADVGEACARLPVPAFVRVRLPGLGNQDAAGFARSLEHLADECARRYRGRTEGLLRWTHPAALLVLGAFAAVQFAAVMTFLNDVRAGVMPW